MPPFKIDDADAWNTARRLIALFLESLLAATIDQKRWRRDRFQPIDQRKPRDRESEGLGEAAKRYAFRVGHKLLLNRRGEASVPLWKEGQIFERGATTRLKRSGPCQSLVT